MNVASQPVEQRDYRHRATVVVHPVDPASLLAARTPASGTPLALEHAVRAQEARARCLGLPRAWNSRIPGRLLPGAVEPSRAAQARLIQSARTLGLTARGVHRVLRVARTIADLGASPLVEEPHVAEAVTFRVGS